MFKAALKLFLNILLFLFMLFCLVWHELVVYGISQAKGQLYIIRKSQPVEEVLADPSFPDSLKQKLLLIADIKKFTVDSLGIYPSDNYTTVFNQHKKAILWTISAAEPYAMKAKEWTFPFLGTVSYKGFFNKKMRDREILELVKDNYDIDVYSPSGWSTLGWFRDPILSNMLYKNEGELSNLIIHELTHGTLYVKNDVTFNENLASFIGDKGAELFLAQQFGKESKEFTNYENSKTDDKIYNDYILKSAKRLDSLYYLLGRGISEDMIKIRKKELIMEIVLGVNRLNLHKPKLYFNYTKQALKEGNAFFMSFTRYDSQYDVFEKEYNKVYHSNLGIYLKAMKKKYPSL
jgi:predicted aminopeptidase